MRGKRRKKKRNTYNRSKLIQFVMIVSDGKPENWLFPIEKVRSPVNDANSSGIVPSKLLLDKEL